MAVYRNIQTTFWTDVKVADDFTTDDRLFYLYLFTNPHTNLCGCYEISKKQIALESGFSSKVIDELLNRFMNVHKIIVYAPDTKEILLLNWHKYNWTKSADFRKSVIKEIASIKNPMFRDHLQKIFNGEETVSTPSIDGGGTTVTVSDTDTVTVTDTQKPSSRFTPPTVDEVRSYCAERKNGVDPQHFVDFRKKP